MFEALAFDLDDTLYLERDYVASGFRATAAWCARTFGGDVATIAADFARLFAQDNDGTVFDRWLVGRGIERDLHLQALVAVYRDHDPQILPVAGARACLVELHRRYKLALVTDGTTARQGAKLRALGLSELFDAIVISDEIGPDAQKPDPRPFRLAAERLGVAPTRIVYLADNPAKDFVGARRAGLASIRVHLVGGLHRERAPASAAYAPDAAIEILSAAAVEDAIQSIARGGPVQAKPEGH